MKTQATPIVLVIIRDCHARHNLVVTANNEREERTYRRMATKQGYLVAVRKPKSPTCDLHTAISKFERMMAAKAGRKGGAA